MKAFRALLVLTLFSTLLSIPPSVAASKPLSFQAEVWADNWFALYINGKKVGEDSVPITTERSFNSEKIKFSATYPFTVGVQGKDFTENASGLEYIGKPNQQIGDAGIIFQIRDLASGNVVAASDSTWKSLVLNTAPLNPSCVTSTTPLTACLSKSIAIPASWSTSAFKDNSWKPATMFTKEEVGVKEGYFDITWSEQAQLIWSSDLKLDNSVLFRKVITTPKSKNSTTTTKTFSLTGNDFGTQSTLPITYTCDGTGAAPGFSWSGAPSGTKSFVLIMDSIPGPPRPGETDSGIHYYLTLFNIPSSINSIPAGNSTIGTLGMNFKEKTPGYTPPCSQGPGAKIYTATIYALSSTLSLLPTEATGEALIKAMNGKILGKQSLAMSYERK